MWKNPWMLSLALSVLAAGMATAGPPVTLTRLNGSSLQGELVSLTESEVELSGDSGTQKVPTDEVMRIDVRDIAPPGPNAEAVVVTMVDGSQIQLSNLTTDGTTASSQSPLVNDSVSMRQVSTIRFRPLEDSIASTWQDFIDRNARDDLLVTRRGDVLDYVAGSVGSITEDKVAMVVRGRELAAPRERVFGIIYARDQPGRKQGIAARTLAGDTLQAKSVRLNGENLELTTASLGTVTIPQSDLHSLDYGGGRIRFLADLPFDASESKSPDAEAPIVWFVSANSPAGTGGQAPLRLGDREFRRGLWLHSGASVRYRLNREFTQLRALAGFDLTHVTRMPQFEPRVALRIVGDGKELYQKEFSWNDEPQPLEVDVTDVRELVIEVRSLGGRQGILEHFALADAQLIQ